MDWKIDLLADNVLWLLYSEIINWWHYIENIINEQKRDYKSLLQPYYEQRTNLSYSRSTSTLSTIRRVSIYCFCRKCRQRGHIYMPLLSGVLPICCISSKENLFKFVLTGLILIFLGSVCGCYLGKGHLSAIFAPYQHFEGRFLTSKMQFSHNHSYSH